MNVEERRATESVARAILDGHALRPLVDRLDDDPVELGTRLWRTASSDADDDDRPLYWARLRVAAALRERGVDPTGFQLAARGMPADGPEPTDPATVLVTGFDPYKLDEDVRHGNPSAAIALALDGRTVAGHPVRGMVFPVRYAEFDAGLVERILGGYAGRVAWIVTVSQGRPDQFDLELWNGRRRSADRPDNNGEFGGGRPTEPLVPPGMPSGPEFVRASLPFPTMAGAEGGAYPVVLNSSVIQLLPGGLPQEAAEPAPEAVAVAGGGGGYLSNEIAYRNTLLLAGAAGPTLGGHVHTPVLPLPPDVELTGVEMAQARSDIIAQFVELLETGLAGG